MRAQVSLELLVYASLAMASVALAVSGASSALSKSGWSAGAYAISQFVDRVNLEMSGGGASFSAFVPSGMCNASVSGRALITVRGTFYFARKLSVYGLCPDGEQAVLYLSWNSGLLELRRSP